MCGNPLRLLSPVAAIFGAGSDQKKALRAQNAAQQEAAALAAKTQRDAQQAEAKASRSAPNLAALMAGNKAGSAAATLLTGQKGAALQGLLGKNSVLGG